jgi:16S rRNA G966 N2-methylase RsmD
LAKYNAIPNFSATWFIDPPYEGAGKHYKMGSSLIDYNRLGEWCKTRDGQVIVCENSGASWLPFKEVGNTKTSRKDKTSSEAVWIKGFNGQ